MTPAAVIAIQRSRWRVVAQRVVDCLDAYGYAQVDAVALDDAQPIRSAVRGAARANGVSVRTYVWQIGDGTCGIVVELRSPLSARAERYRKAEAHRLTDVMDRYLTGQPVGHGPMPWRVTP